MVGATLSHYEIVDRLGAGGMGEVYVARDTRLERLVALKVLPEEWAENPERLERFEREAKALAALNHPNIVTVYSVEEAAGLRFFTMELVEGTTLDRVIPPEGLPVQGFFEIAIPLARAISAAHEHGVVHRDLKLGNIMVANDAQVKVLDFGLAKLRRQPGRVALLETEASTDALTGEGRLAGTLPYMSPEQLRGGPVDQRTDIFSLGVIFYRMITGQHPFRGDSSADLASSILRDTPLAVTQLKRRLPRHLGRIIRLLLEKDPERRYQSAKDLRNELEDLEREISTPTLEIADTAGSAKRGMSRYRLLLVGGSVIAALTVGMMVWPGEHSRGPPSPHLLSVVNIQSFGGDVVRDHFSSGLTHAMSLRLAGLRGAYVVPAGRESLAEVTLETDEMRVGDRITISYLLRDRRHGRVLGGDLLEGSVDEFFPLLDEVGVNVAETLRSDLDVRARFVAPPVPTGSVRAWDFYLRGWEFDNPEEIDQAIAHYRQALAEDADFALARSALGTALWQRQLDEADPESLGEAHDLCEQAAVADPELAAAHLCLGQVRRSLGRPLLAVGDLVRAIELDATLESAYQAINNAHLTLGLQEAAEATWTRVIEYHPSYWAGYFYLGGYHYHQGNYEAALAQYARAAELAPLNAEIQTNRAAMFYFLGRYEEATSAIQKAIRIRPDFSAYATLGSTYFIMRRFDEAVAAFEKSIELRPGYYRLHGYLGRACYWAPGRRADARTQFETALVLGEQHLAEQPDDSDAMLMTAYHLAGLDRRDEALAYLDRALRASPNNNHYFFIAGLIHSRLGATEEALDWLEQAVAGGYSTAEIRAVVDLDELRDEPRFKALLETRNRFRPSN